MRKRYARIVEAVRIPVGDLSGGGGMEDPYTLRSEIAEWAGAYYDTEGVLRLPTATGEVRAPAGAMVVRDGEDFRVGNARAFHARHREVVEPEEGKYVLCRPGPHTLGKTVSIHERAGAEHCHVGVHEDIAAVVVA